MSIKEDASMQRMWDYISKHYWEAKDLEEKQRILLSEFLKNKSWEVLELWCWNGKVLWKIKSLNPDLKLTWLDYNQSMIDEAKINYKWIDFFTWDIKETDKIFKKNKFETVFSLNSLHNLPNLDLINVAMNKMSDLVKNWWYLIFDIRNSFNLFINYWYRKNRKNGLNFWTLNYLKILNKFRKSWFDVIINKWIYYDNIEESLFQSKSIFIKLLYRIYLKLTSIKFFSPYIFVVLKKK